MVKLGIDVHVAVRDRQSCRRDGLSDSESAISDTLAASGRRRRDELFEESLSPHLNKEPTKRAKLIPGRNGPLETPGIARNVDPDYRFDAIIFNLKRTRAFDPSSCRYPSSMIHSG